MLPLLPAYVPIAGVRLVGYPPFQNWFLCPFVDVDLFMSVFFPFRCAFFSEAFHCNMSLSEGPCYDPFSWPFWLHRLFCPWDIPYPSSVGPLLRFLVVPLLCALLFMASIITSNGLLSFHSFPLGLFVLRFFCSRAWFAAILLPFFFNYTIYPFCGAFLPSEG